MAPSPGRRSLRALALLAALALLVAPPHVGAEDAPADNAPAISRKEKLADEFSDPLTTLPQLFTQDVYTPKSFGTAAQTNRLIARMIVPRVPGASLFPFVQLIRPSVSLVTAPTGRGSTTVTGLGDFQLFDLAVLPWPDRSTGLYAGVGPVLVFPTATQRATGQGAWQVGPAFGTIYKGLPGVLLGCLIQNPISFAYTAPDRATVNTLLFQPVLLGYLGHGFYLKSADSTWSMGWRHRSATLLPISAGLGYVLLREDTPPINLFVSGEWLAYRQSAPVAPQTTVRFGVTVAFPDWRPW
jgi:hypothetical protein